MSNIFLYPIFLLTVVTLFTNVSYAQIDTPEGRPRAQEDIPKGIQESLARQRIEREKKEFAELLARGEEAIKISNDLEKSFTATNQLSADDRKKLERLEKVVKKIRSEIGADSDNDDKSEAENKPLSMITALKTLQDSSTKLVEELKKNTRYSVSVIAIESSNVLLKVVRFLKIGKG